MNKIEELADVFGLECPSSSNCGNLGTLTVADINGDPEPEQCEFCYCEPKSKFNLLGRVTDLIQQAVEEQKEKDAEIVKSYFKKDNALMRAMCIEIREQK